MRRRAVPIAARFSLLRRDRGSECSLIGPETRPTQGQSGYARAISTSIAPTITYRYADAEEARPVVEAEAR
jgi:hypothetical protein